ncbi:MAG TPA: MoxR family ATPase [Alphaproteobacteria bacterium]|nr:MoxR family ATPase [Alphaproteobacteria bacterium]
MTTLFSTRLATPNEAPPDLIAAIEATGRKLGAIREAIGQVIFGQDEVVNQSLTAILSGGHMLLIGVPGLAKTRLVDTLGTVLGLNARRIQCTPDLMPSDILGTEVMEESENGRRNFRFIPGPVFSQLLMADEINRASPRTQSALLQAMQEHQVTVAGHNHPLPAPFHVMATQNPLEQEGTYPLPEAQLDRFLLQIDIDYPDLDAERQMLLATTMSTAHELRATLTAAELQELQKLVRRMPISEKTVDGILALVRSGRPDSSGLDIVKKYVAWGPGPRASQALSLASRARALIDGRLSPSLDDVLALAKPALQHRMALSFAARAEGVTLDKVLHAMTQSVADL